MCISLTLLQLIVNRKTRMEGAATVRMFGIISFVLYLPIWIISSQVSLATANPLNYIYEDSFSLDDLHCDFLTPDHPSEDCDAYLNGGVPPLVLISLDGFRPEYLKRASTYQKGGWAASTINCLSDKGVSAPFMTPSYPTITFPNHYSIVTGLYPESHEMVGNMFYDPKFKANFSLRNNDARHSKWWLGGEPIWSTVRKEGMKSATFFWPGSDVEYGENEKRAPNIFYKYNKSIPLKERVRQVIEWLDQPSSERPSLITLYFEEPDSTGHSDGPKSSTVTEKISLVDNQIRNLFDGLKALSISSCVNLMIVSDHGMAESPAKKQLVNLQRHYPSLLNESMATFGPITAIYPNSDNKDDQERILRALKCKDENMHAFKKWDLPYRMHFSNSRRIPPIVLDFNVGWRGVFGQERYNGSGAHGWDNLYPEMQSIFLAYGPSFKSNFKTKPFENIQLYNLMSALLNVTPAANNGTWGALHHLLLDPPTLTEGYSDEDVEMISILEVPSDKENVATKTCGSSTGRDMLVELWRDEWKMSEDRRSEIISFHAPLGVPTVYQKQHNLGAPANDDQVLLLNEDYLQVFDTKRGVPVLSSYTIANTTANASSEGVWIEDPRIESGMTSGCKLIARGEIGNQQDTLLALFPKDFATRVSDVWLDTNIVSLPSGMGEIVHTMTQLFRKAYSNKGLINVATGIIDRTHPTMFYVVTSCLVDSTHSDWNITYCPVEQRDVQAFLLPTNQWTRNKECTTNEEFIAFNVATLKDVESLTGFNFFPDLSAEEKAQLLSRAILGSNLVIEPTRSRGHSEA